MDNYMLNILQDALWAVLVGSIILALLAFVLSLYSTPFREIVELNILKGVPFLLAGYISFTVWLIAAKESGSQIFLLVPIFEGAAGYIYCRHQQVKRPGEIVDHLVYWTILGYLASRAAYYATSVFATMSRGEFSLSMALVMGLLLISFSFLFGKATFAYIDTFCALLKAFKAKHNNDRVQRTDERKTEAQKRREQETAELRERKELETRQREMEIEAVKNEQLKAQAKQQEEELQKLDSLRRQEIAKLFADLFCSKHNLDPDSFGHVYTDALKYAWLLEPDQIRTLSDGYKALEVLFSELGRGLGYYMVDRQMVRDQVTNHRRMMTPEESEVTDRRIGKITQELFGLRTQPQPVTSKAANEQVISEYQRRFPGNTASEYSYRSPLDYIPLAGNGHTAPVNGENGSSNGADHRLDLPTIPMDNNTKRSGKNSDFGGNAR